MKLTLSVAHQLLREQKEATFQEIFEALKVEQEEYWKKSFPKLSPEKIKMKKQGELFVYLTTSGRFVLGSDKKWGLVENHKYSDVQKMRVNIGEK